MTQAYATPVCASTRTAILTGRFPQRSGVYGNYDGAHPGIGPTRDSFPPRLQQAGYRMAWFGKWHQGWDVANHPLNNGWDVAYPRLVHPEAICAARIVQRNHHMWIFTRN